MLSSFWHPFVAHDTPRVAVHLCGPCRVTACRYLPLFGATRKRHTPRPKKGAKISSLFLLNLARAPHYKGGVPPTRHASLHVPHQLRGVLEKRDVRQTGARPSGGRFMQGSCRRCACTPYGPCLVHSVEVCKQQEDRRGCYADRRDRAGEQEAQGGDRGLKELLKKELEKTRQLVESLELVFDAQTRYTEKLMVQ